MSSPAARPAYYAAVAVANAVAFLVAVLVLVHVADRADDYGPRTAPTPSVPAQSVEPGTVLTAKPRPTLPPVHPCAEEDSPGPCYYNAASRGTGTGRSFLVTVHGVVRVLAAPQAEHLDHLARAAGYRMPTLLPNRCAVLAERDAVRAAAGASVLPNPCRGRA